MTPGRLFFRIFLLVVALVGMAHPAAGAFVRENNWITNGTVRAITHANNTIYLGGGFTHVGPPTGAAAALDPTSGVPAHPYARVLGTVYAVSPDGNGGYYLGGLFTSVQGQLRTNLAQIDANGAVTSWNPGANGEVDAIAVSGGVVYVGGVFSNAGGLGRNWVAAIDAVSASAMSWNPGLDNRVRFIAVHGALLYIGGDFTAVDGSSRVRVAQFDLPAGTLTSSFQGGTTYTLHAMTIAAGRLYLGLSLSAFYGLEVRDATTLQLISNGPALDGPVTAVTADPVSGTVYVAGDFVNIGGFLRKGLAALDPSTYAVLDWKPIVFFGKNGPIKALAFAGGQVIAGGSFSNIDNNARNHLFAADPFPANPPTINLWDPNPSAPVHALGLNGGTLLVGGEFVTINAARRNNAAAIDPVSGTPRDWNPNVNGRVNAIMVSGTTAYLGGAFSSVGGVTRNRAAAVDAVTAQLRAFDPNVNVNFPTEVTTFGIYSSTVYMGGAFATVGGATRGGIAAVDATSGAVLSWNPGVNGSVYAMRLIPPLDVFAPPTVLIGGQFTQAGGAARSNIASLNGGTGAANAWNPGANASVSTLVAFTNKFGVFARAYVGGGFSTIGGVARSCIAEIDANGVPTSWNPGANGDVQAIATSGTNVYAGGAFTVYGGQPRSHFGAVNTATGLATAWDPMAAGGLPAGYVYSLLKLNGTVYAGGSFLTMSGTLQCHIAGVLEEVITGVEGEAVSGTPPTVVRAAPNPFGSATDVVFSLATREPAVVTVYDVQGRLVRRLHEGMMSAGRHSIPWDGLDERGRTVGSGAYFASVRTPTQSLGAKLYRLR